MNLVHSSDGRSRCGWGTDDAQYTAYHDTEWGFCEDNDVRLFEKVCLEGFQAGLSWLTILRKRENFRAAFNGFVPELVAGFGESDVVRLLGNEGIVRHRGKIEAAINNGGRACDLIDEVGSLADYFWAFEPERRVPPAELPATTEVSLRLAKDLKQRGWRFVGPTTCYAFMQAMGMVNDHLEGCFVRDDAEASRSRISVGTRSESHES